MPVINRRDSTTWPIGLDITYHARYTAWKKDVANGTTELSLFEWSGLFWKAGQPEFEAWADAPVERAGPSDWSGSPAPDDPDNIWIADATGERVDAKSGETE